MSTQAPPRIRRRDPVPVASHIWRHAIETGLRLEAHIRDLERELNL